MNNSGQNTGAGMWYFDNINLFTIFCPHKFSDYRESHEFRKYKKGEFVYFTDDPSSSIYLIAEGKVKILYYTEDGDEVIKSVLAKGDVFGELSLLGEEKRKDYAMAVQDNTSICHLNIDQMENLMKKNRPLSIKINKLIGLRIRKLERRVEALVFKDVRTRMLEFLREFAEERGEASGNAYQVNHFLTHKDMADLIGTTRQTVKTLLNELRNEGKIDFSRRSIYIPDIKALSSG